MNIKKYTLFVLLFASICFCILSCDENNQETEPQLKDAFIESYQAELINIAFEVSSEIPVYPHIKSRCLEQQNVVKTCLNLNQPQMALGFTKQIENWRKQLCYAELALYCAKHGYKKTDVQYFLNLAAQVPDNTEDWRKDQVDAKVAQTKSVLELSKQQLDTFDKEIESLEKLVSTENFDVSQNALLAYSELYNRFYSNTERRNLIENKIKSSWSKMPILFRIELLLDMSKFSLDHNDKGQALKLVNESREMMDSETWQPRYKIPLLAKIATYHAFSGEQNSAKTKLQEAIDIYDENKDNIVNIDKAGILRPIAEAYMGVGDISFSRSFYKRVLEAGIENSNSRPRAEDLSATCCSMALSNVEPEQELLNRIKEIKENLSDPW